MAGARIAQSVRNRQELLRLEALAERLDPAARQWLLARIEERRMQWASERRRAAARRSGAKANG